MSHDAIAWVITAAGFIGYVSGVAVAVISVSRDPKWVTFHHDWSMISVHRSEKAALRHAVANKAEVGRLEVGKEYGGGRYPTKEIH